MPFWHEPAPDARNFKVPDLRSSYDQLVPELEDDFYRRLGGLLGGLRESRGLSQEALAVQLQRDQSYVSRIESGDRHASVLLLLEWAEALGVSFGAIAGEIARLRTSPGVTPGSPSRTQSTELG